MSYRAELINKVRTKEYLPNFDKPNFILELNNIAMKAAVQRNVFGYLSAVFIYHQMKEEILKALFRKAKFYAQLRRLPEEVYFSQDNYLVFDYTINEVDGPEDFLNRNEMIDLSREIDRIRNEIVKRLSEGVSVEEIEKLAAQVKKQFEIIFSTFKECNLWFYKKIKEFENASWG
jgi:hypothetical protein